MEKTINSITPMFGHCQTDNEKCLQKIFRKYQTNRAKDELDVWHWWCVDVNGKLIDLTEDQYYKRDRIPPYDKGIEKYLC